MKSIKDIFRSHAVFDDQGRHTNGTDKESNHHYGEAYECLFPDREAIKLVLEIGVADGASLCAWREVFPNATIVGMDIHPSAQATGPRMEFHIGDQRSHSDCIRVAAGRQFDVIIEDATHETANNLLTLFYMWPYVKPGGLYIIEEWGNVHALRSNILHLFPHAFILDTVGPSGGIEPLVALRKQ